VRQQARVPGGGSAAQRVGLPASAESAAASQKALLNSVASCSYFLRRFLLKWCVPYLT